MSTKDDLSLLAMQAAAMSPRAMALTMGWGLERTTKRLQLLNDGLEAAGHGAALAAGQLAAFAAKAEEIQPLDELPIADGQGLVIRSFALAAGGHGADCLLADGRRVFTVTGRDRQDPGKRIQVVQVPAADAFPRPAHVEEGVEPPPAATGHVWRMVKARADA